MKELLLCVTYTAKHGEKEKFIDEVSASGILEKIRQEDGCLQYEYYYAAQDEDKIVLVEKWENEEKQQIHMKQPHMEQLKDIKEKYVIHTKLEKAFVEAE